MFFNDFDQYARCCQTRDDETLQREDQKYRRVIAQGSVAMALGIVSVLILGPSVIGPWVYQATFANAVSKLSIITNETLRCEQKRMLNIRLKNFFGDIASGSTQASFDDDDTTFNTDNSVPSLAGEAPSS